MPVPDLDRLKSFISFTVVLGIRTRKKPCLHVCGDRHPGTYFLGCLLSETAFQSSLVPGVAKPVFNIVQGFFHLLIVLLIIIHKILHD